MKLHFVIEGQPASKANRRRLAYVGDKLKFIKSREALTYVQAAVMQVPVWARRHLSGRCGIRLKIFYASERSDLDESLILDCLQHAGVVVNDRQFRVKHVYHGIDKGRPRAEVVVWELTQ